MADNIIDPQTVFVRCATKDRVPYIYVEPANSGTVDGIAELVFTVADGCDATLVEVKPSRNCRVIRQDVRDDGRVLEVDLAYRMPNTPSTTLTYALWVRDGAGTLQQAYGDELTGDHAVASPDSLLGGATPYPPPEIQFP